MDIGELLDGIFADLDSGSIKRVKKKEEFKKTAAIVLMEELNSYCKAFGRVLDEDDSVYYSEKDVFDVVLSGLGSTISLWITSVIDAENRDMVLDGLMEYIKAHEDWENKP